MAIFSFLPNIKSLRALFNNDRQNNIDLLRAIAVVSVFIHHAQHVYGGNFPFFGEYGGQFGPQLFFVISGYLISASCQKHSLRDYAIHRIFRIIPAYLFFFIGIGVLTGIINFHRITQLPWEFLANLLLLQQLFPSALISFDVLHVTWTLTVEVLWYALAPLLVIGNRTLRWPT
ncbi:MAG: acyltransferase, partial [Giesbergeria sp.]|nr:acyltransferase [Giesbergeria sp.]